MIETWLHFGMFDRGELTIAQLRRRLDAFAAKYCLITAITSRSLALTSTMPPPWNSPLPELIDKNGKIGIEFARTTKARRGRRCARLR
jgi:hypothetical protein